MDLDVKKEVAALYNRFPYPNYPLFARPRWQDGYLTSSYFSGRLLHVQRQVGTGSRGQPESPPAPRGPVLVAGCGEMLPYILRKWEPPEFPVVNVDLSKRSLQRGRIRTLLTRGRSEFVTADVVDFLDRCAETDKKFAHVETFGMLHHMDQPAAALRAIHRQLMPGGTLRVMVYNSPARDWIHALQDYFKATVSRSGEGLLQQVSSAREILADFASQSPLIAEKVRAIGKMTMTNPARFADTFLHPHELRWPIEKWFEVFTASGFTLAGVFDRYGELDDLPNPLHSPGNLAELTQALSIRAEDKRFEGNLETIWFKSCGPKEAPLSQRTERNTNHLARLKFRLPPLHWFDFEETRHLAVSCRMRIWHGFLDGTPLPSSAWGKQKLALQRLARLGAIMPDQLDPISAELAVAPMTATMTPPDFAPHSPLTLPENFKEQDNARIELNRKLSSI